MSIHSPSLAGPTVNACPHKTSFREIQECTVEARQARRACLGGFTVASLSKSFFDNLKDLMARV